MQKLQNKVWNGIISAVFAIAAVILILTFSIGLPIYFRPFYYMQIDSLEIKETALLYNDHYNLGYEESEITNEALKDAYDEILDYLTLGKEFGTGIFKYSDDGKSHFADCKILFDLNAIALVVSLAIVVTTLVLAKKNIIRLSKPFGFNMMFIACVGMLAVFAIVGTCAVAVGFDKAFTVFHKILFPGKYNWYFDPHSDGIILALPEEFFMACAILILSSIVLLTSAAIAYGIYDKLKSAKTQSSGNGAQQTPESTSDESES